MVSTTTKLHIVLVLSVVAVAVYMYFLYRELQNYQQDVIDLRRQVANLGGGACPITSLKQSELKTEKVESQRQEVEEPYESEDIGMHNECLITNNEDDDDVSVTSNEIKDILTNIQEPEDDSNNDDFVISDIGKSSLPDLKNKTDEELMELKYDEIRSYVRRFGINTKGTKKELIQKIREHVP